MSFTVEETLRKGLCSPEREVNIYRGQIHLWWSYRGHRGCRPISTGTRQGGGVHSSRTTEWRLVFFFHLHYSIVRTLIQCLFLPSKVEQTSEK